MTPNPVADAVMARRRTPVDELDYFPTPPWATRAFMHEWLLRLAAARARARLKVLEPAAGGGHMAEVLREECTVHATDVHDWGPGYPLGSFVGGGLEPLATCPFAPDWIVTNPPFNLALAFAQRALSIATQGVALLCRSGWSEGVGRYNGLFGPRPPSFVIQYSERVPMVKGRWDPDATTATAYAWYVWDNISGEDTRYRWLPPGREAAWTRADDRARFALPSANVEIPAGLFETGVA
jgi:hypothetical protein